MSETPHDALFKAVFSRADQVIGEFHSVLPAELCRQLDERTLRAEPGSFIDPELRARHADLLYSVRTLQEEDLLIYLLLEHQSTFDPWLPRRLLAYQDRIWGRWVLDHPHVRTLPPVVSVVIYHGEKPWSADPSLRSLLAPAHQQLGLERFFPDFDFVLDDLSRVSDAQLQQRSLNALGCLALLVLKHARTAEDFQHLLFEWTNLMREVATAPEGAESLLTILRYVFTVSRSVKREDLVQLVSTELDPTVGEQVMAMGKTVEEIGFERGLEKGIEKGMERGIEKGIEKGIEQGRAEGARRTLLGLMRSKFGPLKPDVTLRIESSSPEELERWANRILAAGSPEEVFQ